MSIFLSKRFSSACSGFGAYALKNNGFAGIPELKVEEGNWKDGEFLGK